jgi:hypothetical protein
LVKTSPGSLWLAAQALPCHAIQISSWATASVISPLKSSASLSLAMVSDQLVKISEPSSQTLLYDVAACCKLDTMCAIQ